VTAVPARLLLVEDEPGLAEVLTLHLRRAGFAVDVAGDGLSALGVLELVRPDVVLLDLTLPRLSGFRLLQLLRRDPATADVPVLVLTAPSFQEAQEVARAGGRRPPHRAGDAPDGRRPHAGAPRPAREPARQRAGHRGPRLIVPAPPARPGPRRRRATRLGTRSPRLGPGPAPPDGPGEAPSGPRG
jgi:CheY-like chemotaxis protein